MKNEESKHLKINFPPVMTLQEIGSKQQAGVSPDAAKTEFAAEIPPSLRSIIELSHLMLSPFSQWLHATPGFQQGLLYRDKNFCLASGYRDGSRARSVEDKGNIIRLRDPLVYGSLSLPITVAYLCHLHGQETFDLNRPITHYLPELSEKISNEVTARSILSFQTVLDEHIIFKDVKANILRAYLSPSLCTSVSTRIYEPIEKYFSVSKKSEANQNSKIAGKLQRENLIRYIQTSNKLKNAIVRTSQRRSYISHFTIALLIAAIERQLKESCFEESIEQNFFWKAESKAVGYGPPQLWRDPHSLFYQPTGTSMQHLTFKTPITEDNKIYHKCAPAIFNASLNLYGPVEEYAKLLSLSLDVIRDAQDILGKQTSQKSHYDLGLINVPKKHLYILKPRWIGGLDALPSVASLRFNDKYDYGVFTITNCGTRFARFFTSLGCRTLHGLVYKHLIIPNLNEAKCKRVQETEQSTELDEDDTPKKVKEQLSKSEVKKFFKNLHAHTWS